MLRQPRPRQTKPQRASRAARRYLPFLALVWLSIPALAHVVSVSTGELRVEGQTATYELRMPTYEVAHVVNPEQALLDQLQLEGATRVSGACEDDESEGFFICRAEYAFTEPVPDSLKVTCTLYTVTVPNHVHLLYAVQGENSDQVVLDQSFPDAEIRFHPPSLSETLQRDGTAGIGRLLGSVAGLLFLGAMALAARDRKEALQLAAGYLIAQWIALPLALLVPIGLSETFLEAAMALTVAYLAAEVLLLPSSTSRWMIVLLLGLVHGLAFAAFPVGYLAGAGLAQVAILAVLVYLTLGLSSQARRRATLGLLAVSILWFGVLLVL